MTLTAGGHRDRRESPLIRAVFEAIPHLSTAVFGRAVTGMPVPAVGRRDSGASGPLRPRLEESMGDGEHDRADEDTDEAEGD